MSRSMVKRTCSRKDSFMSSEKKPYSRICRFVSPYPGECCYSMLARCKVYSAYSTSRFIHELTGTIRRLDRFLFMPFSYALSDARLFEMKRLVYAHSCLPYAAPLLDEEDMNLVKKLTDGIFLSAGECKRLTRHTGIIHWMKRFLCYCPLCVQQDRARYGETYWRLILQLPGIWICPEHGIQIEESGIAMSSIRYDLIPAEFALKSIPEVRFQKTKDRIQEFIANETQWLLENGLQIASQGRKNNLQAAPQSQKVKSILKSAFPNDEKYFKSSILYLILCLDEQGKRISQAYC